MHARPLKLASNDWRVSPGLALLGPLVLILASLGGCAGSERARFMHHLGVLVPPSGRGHDPTPQVAAALGDDGGAPAASAD